MKKYLKITLLVVIAIILVEHSYSCIRSLNPR